MSTATTADTDVPSPRSKPPRRRTLYRGDPAMWSWVLHRITGVALGVGAFVHYGVTMGDGAMLAPDSFLMKGEAVPPGAHWAGNPAVEIVGKTAGNVVVENFLLGDNRHEEKPRVCRSRWLNSASCRRF